MHELTKLPAETEYVEFKQNFAEPEKIGQYISALSNSAALKGKPSAYLVWGIDNDTHEIVGTKFKPHKAKKGNEELENWLLRLLKPKIDFSFYEVLLNGNTVVLLEIQSANHQPVQFQNIDYIRIGSTLQKLKEHGESERKLWRIFDKTPFEELVAAKDRTGEQVLELLDYSGYCQLLDRELPKKKNVVLEMLEAEKMIKASTNKKWDILNLGAILLANNLNEFKSLDRKAIRIIEYKDRSRIASLGEYSVSQGYAVGFESIIEQVSQLIPPNEVIGKAFRTNTPMYPPIAIRELVANAIIHQDFMVRGSGTMIEIFSDRIEITNPGKPLIDTQRFLDNPPQSRNEILASFMRRIGVCEERGSGVDKIVAATEAYQLPAPIFEAKESHTITVLFSHRELKDMDTEDRVQACYLHACLRNVMRDFMTNSSLRERFGIDPQNSAMASRIIRDTLNAGLIQAHDENASKKFMKYIPFWG